MQPLLHSSTFPLAGAAGHSTLGLYAVGILLLWATDRLLIFLLLPSPETELDDWNAKELEDADQLRDESESDASPDGGRGSCAPTFGAD